MNTAHKSSMLRIDLDVGVMDLDGLNVQELVEWAEGVRESVPEQWRQFSKLEWEGGGGEYSGMLSGYYERPETDQDRRLTREKHEREEREAEAARHAKEYAEYQRLKTKYEKSA